MTVKFNHTTVLSKNAEESSKFVAEILGCPTTVFGPFQQMQTANELTLDFLTIDTEISPQHYAFLVSDEHFDAIFGRIRDRGLAYWGDPFKMVEGEINHFDGGRGVYFEDPSGHYFEAYTRPYGSGGTTPEDIARFVQSHTGKELGKKVESSIGNFEIR